MVDDGVSVAASDHEGFDAASEESFDPEYKQLKPKLLAMPQKGTYITLRIDPAGTLETLDDAEIGEVTAKMETQNYVGYVEQVLNNFDKDFPFRAVSVRLLHDAPPEPCELEGVEARMCFPVRPTTAHPESIRPLAPNKPLPWASCYHPTLPPLATFRVRYSKAYDHESWWLHPAEIVRVQEGDWRDKERRAALRKTYQAKFTENISREDALNDTQLEKPSRGPEDNGAPSGQVECPGDENQEGQGNVIPVDNAEDIMGIFAMMNEIQKEGRPHET